MKKTKIALVDDHDLFLQGMSALLAPIAHLEVLYKAENGQVFLDLLNEGAELPDIVLLDLKMPVLDGIETLKIVKQEYPSIKVIILSMHQEEQFILHLVELDANGYLLKNSTITEVLQAIDAVNTKTYYYDDFLTQIMRKGLMSKKREKVSVSETIDLSKRELEILDLICQQHTASEIADKLFLSRRTIEGYKKDLLAKMGVRNTAGLIVYCLKNKLVQLNNY